MAASLLSKSPFQFLAALFWAGLWIFGYGVFLAFLMRWWPGDRILPVRLLNYLMPWLLAVLPPAALLALLTHRNLLALILAAPAAFILIVYLPLFLPSGKAEVEGMPLKVMSYNIWRQNTDMEAVAGVIGGEKPDIVLLQEIEGRRLGELMAGLSDVHEVEFFAVAEERLGQAVISRFPLEQVGASWRKGKALEVLLETPRGPIRVINVHPLRGQWQRKQKQVADLLADGGAGPLILGGDFNTTEMTSIYRSIRRFLENAHWEAGWGFGFTYPSSSLRLQGGLPVPPLVRIDHIFYSSHFSARSASTLPDSGGSDHLPVVADLVLNPN